MLVLKLPHPRSLKGLIPTIESVRSDVINSSIRVTDNGRASINRKVCFVFTLYSTSYDNDQLKASKTDSPCRSKNVSPSPKNIWSSLRSANAKSKDNKVSVHWPFHSSVNADAMTSDVVAPSPWKIFGCQNDVKIEDVALKDDEGQKTPLGLVSLLGLNEEADEFFDVPEADEFTDYDRLDKQITAEINISKPFSEKIAEFCKSKEGMSIKRWLGTTAESSPTEPLSKRTRLVLYRAVERGGPEFFFIINMQIPGSPTYTLALYYMIKTPIEDHPLLYKFVDGDDAYRNTRFKLIPYISKGSWIVKQSVGKKACLLGQALDTRYFRGKNYLEAEIDIGSSTVARGIANLVLGYLNNLVVEMAFIIQGNTQEELPESLLGTCRLNHLDLSKAPVAVP
ncbi:Ribophorin I isoform 1 [Hibiscus syriacus]|uniref:Ribophorin I isoform 1 n=1 Tax=Hibiscus syriacus TaxID=106335 RepID=A0A6A2Z3J7_HIBSY|nr:Ribophorin I isoform 1 [Hibiscus syriacus]